MNLGAIIKTYRKEHSMSMDDFAKVSSLSKAYIGMLEANQNPSSKKPIVPSIDTIMKAARGMGISLDEIIVKMGDEEVSLDEDVQDLNITEESVPSGFKLPLYSELCCGNGLFVEDNIIDHVYLPEHWFNPHKEYFGMKASGDSMSGAQINSGDILIFEKSSAIDSGKIGCFCIDENQAVCKRFMINENKEIYLMPANEKYLPIRIDPAAECFRCVGVLTYVISDRR